MKFLATFFSLTFALSVSAADKPNVLFIAVDDLNCDLGSYGHPLVKSPNIDRLAKRGMLFEKAYCQYPVCNPSRASFMTGLYPEQTKILSNAGHFRDHHPNVVTLAQHFKNNGYYSARVGKIYHFGVPTDIGTSSKDDPASWHEVRNPKGVDKIREEEIHTLQPGKYGGTLSWLRMDNTKDTEHTDGIGATDMIQLLKDHDPKKTSQPFFLAMGFYRPHTPYVAPGHYFDLYPKDKIDPVMMKPGDRDDIPKAALPDRPHQLELTIEKRKEIIQAYYASISLMDAQVGRVLAALEEQGLTDNTVIVFVSDHGYHLGAHGLWQKSDLFEGSARVPLIIANPFSDKEDGKVTQSLAELTDLYPTLVELCGLETPDHVEGSSLVPVLNDPKKKVHRSAYSVTECRVVKRPDKSKFLGRSIRTARYRYTEWDHGEYGVELYDYKGDPEEYTNLAKDPKHAKLLERMRRLLNTRIKDPKK